MIFTSLIFIDDDVDDDGSDDGDSDGDVDGDVDGWSGRNRAQRVADDPQNTRVDRRAARVIVAVSKVKSSIAVFNKAGGACNSRTNRCCHPGIDRHGRAAQGQCRAVGH